MSAQLVAFGLGSAVALGGDRGWSATSRRRDQFAGFGEQGFGCGLGLPVVAGPVVDAAGGGVVAQRV